MDGLLILAFIPLFFFIIEIFIILSILKDQSINNNSKIFWIVLLLFTNILGLIIYFVINDKNILQ